MTNRYRCSMLFDMFYSRLGIDMASEYISYLLSLTNRLFDMFCSRFRIAWHQNTYNICFRSVHFSGCDVVIC
jgi:hypothetical protein